MNKQRAYIVVIICSGLLTAYGCNQKKNDFYQQPENTISIKGSVHEMTLYPEPAPAFPEHDGKAEFVSYCAICHTLKYIKMQPDFPRKTWEAEVTKMITKFKAPVDSVNAKKIVEYLVAVKGKKMANP
jgi:mono/diheme cytochrome c family protein